MLYKKSSGLFVEIFDPLSAENELAEVRYKISTSFSEIFAVGAVEARSAVEAAGERKLKNGRIAVSGVGVHLENLFDADAVDKIADIHFHVFAEHMPERTRRIAELFGKACKGQILGVMIVNVLNNFRKNKSFRAFFCNLCSVCSHDMVNQEI